MKICASTYSSNMIIKVEKLVECDTKVLNEYVKWANKRGPLCQSNIIQIFSCLPIRITKKNMITAFSNH